jgi:hypothetical protein
MGVRNDKVAIFSKVMMLLHTNKFPIVTILDHTTPRSLTYSAIKGPKCEHAP